MGRRGHVGARLDLKAISSKSSELMRLLDGLNATRFVDEPARLGEWESARDVFGPFSRKPDEAPEALPAGAEPEQKLLQEGGQEQAA